MTSRSLTRAASLLRQAPLAGRYPAAVALALLALCPFIILTTAAALFSQQVSRDLGTSSFGVQVTSGLANAAYAFGAVAAADLIKRLPGRWLYLLAEALVVVGSLLCVFAPGIVAYTTGRILEGLGTGLLLVAALPPLVTKFGAEKLPATAAFVNLGLFGMVTLGPLVGGLAAGFGAWRMLFVGIAGLATAGIVTGLLAFEPGEAPAPRIGFDFLAIPFALGGTVLPFFGVSWLTRGSFLSPGFLVPLLLGLASLTVLVVSQYRKQRPLMPVKPISHTLPIVGTGAAMLIGAAFVTLLELAERYLLEVDRREPLLVGALVTTQLLGLVVAAWLFKLALPTKWTPYLVLSGLTSVALGGVVLFLLGRTSADYLVPVAALLLGYGAGAGVSPGLFLAGFSVPSRQIGPTFALVELLRSEAAFLIGPVLLHIAVIANQLADGLHLAFGITLAITVVGGLALLAVYAAGGVRPHPPDLDRWLQGEETAYDSPPLAAALRSDVEVPTPSS